MVKAPARGRWWMVPLPLLAALALVELGARLALGAPPATLFRQRFNPDTPPFSEAGGRVSPDFQQQDAVPPFAARPSLPRVMVFGESSVRGGSRLEPAREFAGLLARRLDGRAEVLNLGRPALDSHSIGPVVHAALAWKPTVAVLYAGHNDLGNAWFERRYPDAESVVALRLRLAFGRLWSYRWLVRGVDAALRPSLPDPFLGMLLPQGPAGTLSEAARRRAEADHALNLDATVRELRGAGVEVVLATVVSDLSRWYARSDCPAALPDERADALVQDWAGLDLAAAERAVAAAPDCAAARFLLGRRLQDRGRLEEGRAALVWARDHDPFATRASSTILADIRAVAERRGARLVDLEAELATRPAAASAGLFGDNIHPSEAGHRWIAEALEPAVRAALAGTSPG